VTINVLDSETATVRVSAADRPGLLQDVATAITGVGLTVESGEITTPMDSFALNTFTVKVGAEGTSASGFLWAQRRAACALAQGAVWSQACCGTVVWLPERVSHAVRQPAAVPGA
jgi:hypothetical protein